LFYIIYFHSHSISKSPADWGVFGDFLGGLINPYVAILTLIVTIYIAVEISKLDDKRNEKAIDFERRRFLNELRESEYRRITTELQKISGALSSDGDEGANDIYAILMHVKHFELYNGHIFPFLQETEMQELNDSLELLWKAKDKKASAAALVELTEAARNFIVKSLAFCKKMQDFILQEV